MTSSLGPGCALAAHASRTSTDDFLSVIKHNLDHLSVLHTMFPIPLLPHLPHSAPFPASAPPVPDTKASRAGQLSLSLRGMCKTLHNPGGCTEALVRGVGDELMPWLGNVAVVLNPAPDEGHQFPRRVASEEAICDVEHNPQMLAIGLAIPTGLTRGITDTMRAVGQDEPRG